jgi:uncharacterized membrane protein HdeD (DUF308 family)
VIPWYAPICRAVPAIVLALVVTFSADHSATLGLATFGAFAVASGAVIGGFALRLPAGTVRNVQLIQASIGLVAGIAALSRISGGLSLLILLLSAFAALTGFLELYLGWRGRGRDRSARDWTFVGVLTIALAVAVLLVPADFRQVFTGPDDIERELTASVIVVGLAGAYWAIIGLFLVIAGLSLKWAPLDAPEIEAS